MLSSLCGFFKKSYRRHQNVAPEVRRTSASQLESLGERSSAKREDSDDKTNSSGDQMCHDIADSTSAKRIHGVTMNREEYVVPDVAQYTSPITSDVDDIEVINKPALLETQIQYLRQDMNEKIENEMKTLMKASMKQLRDEITSMQAKEMQDSVKNVKN